MSSCSIIPSSPNPKKQETSIATNVQILNNSNSNHAEKIKARNEKVSFKKLLLDHSKKYPPDNNIHIPQTQTPPQNPLPAQNKNIPIDNTTPIKKQRKLTLKQQKWVAEYLRNGGNQTQATLAVYDKMSYPVARSIGAENLTKPNVISEVYRLSCEQGLDLPQAIRYLHDLIIRHDGELRLKSLALWFSVTGTLAPRREEHKIIISADDDRRIAEYERSINSDGHPNVVDGELT